MPHESAVFLRSKEKTGEFRTEKLDFQKEGPLTPKTAVWEMHMAHFTKSGDSNPQAFKKRHEKARSRPLAQSIWAGGRLLFLPAGLSLLALMLRLFAIPYWYW